MSVVIKAENISKAYQLGDFGTGTISRDIERIWWRMRGKEDPFLKIGETNDRTIKGESDIVWSLKELDFEIEQGDAVGIIGRNGAGKSTLLKILSRVTSPTTGSVKIKGRIASLLEVGTGFHPELSGRENIYLNGAILGMRKTEIKRKFDEIVDFAGVERYIDTPVKRYSSGMYVRLAFAVAAHLESEIMIIDEVLAVGDAEFQKKCLGKMGEVSKGEGRTVLFVSHNMGAIKILCQKCLLLSNGRIQTFDETNNVVRKYLAVLESANNTWKNTGNEFYNEWFIPINVLTVNKSLQQQGIFENSEPVGVKIAFDIELLHASLVVGFTLYNNDGTVLFWTLHTDKNERYWPKLTTGTNELYAWIPAHFLNEGVYTIKPISAIHYVQWIINPDNTKIEIKFEIKGGLSESPNWMNARPGINAPIIDFQNLANNTGQSNL